MITAPAVAICEVGMSNSEIRAARTHRSVHEQPGFPVLGRVFGSGVSESCVEQWEAPLSTRRR